MRGLSNRLDKLEKRVAEQPTGPSRWTYVDVRGSYEDDDLLRGEFVADEAGAAALAEAELNLKEGEGLVIVHLPNGPPAYLME